jgi:uncharacterized protein (DUF2236 family)
MRHSVDVSAAPGAARSRTRSHAERVAARDGYFSPESVIRRLGNSPVVPLLGGGSAVLLQVAHPLVASGVVDHSDYRHDLWKRLLGTLRALYLITFGSRREADLTGEAVQAVHAHVRGQTRTQLGPFPPGSPYSADDPDLQLWVHATLVYSSIEIYHRYVRPLGVDEQEEYYRDMALVARIFGTPAEVIPPTLTEFREYLHERFRSPEIVVTEPARQVAEVILRAPLPLPLRVLAPTHRLSTSALLPERLRREYGLPWSRARAATLRASTHSISVLAVPLFLAAQKLALPVAAPAASRVERVPHRIAPSRRSRSSLRSSPPP